MSGKALTKVAFLASDDRPLQMYKLDPELYGDDAAFQLRSWEATERSECEKRWAGGKARKDPGGFRWHVIVNTVCNDDGARLFVDADKAEVMAKNAGTIELLFVACCEINGLREADVEELAGNSENGP